MKIRRTLTGVLCSFLDAFASRYSDHEGYWVLGLLAREAAVVTSIDLLKEDQASTGSPALVAASRIARLRFASIREKSRIPLEFVADAKVVLSRLEPSSTGVVHGRVTIGHRYLLRADATSDLGKRYTAEKMIFVAPHDASVEHRSVRNNG